MSFSETFPGFFPKNSNYVFRRRCSETENASKVFKSFPEFERKKLARQRKLFYRDVSDATLVPRGICWDFFEGNFFCRFWKLGENIPGLAEKFSADFSTLRFT